LNWLHEKAEISKSQEQQRGTQANARSGDFSEEANKEDCSNGLAAVVKA
jgi:hypothetical protein